MTRGLRYASVAFLLLAALVGVIGMRIYTLESGEEIRLRTVPMNIESFVLGERVAFEYEIARLNLRALAGDNQFELHKTVYVTLGRLPGGYWVAQSVDLNPPENEGHEVILKGEVIGQEFREDIPPPVRIQREITVRYGIEEYAVPRGYFVRPSGFVNPNRIVTVRAAVTGGRAAITGVWIGNEFYEEPVL